MRGFLIGKGTVIDLYVRDYSVISKFGSVLILSSHRRRYNGWLCVSLCVCGYSSIFDFCFFCLWIERLSHRKPIIIDCVFVVAVTRIEATSHNLDMFMHLDVNTEVYPMAVGDKFTLAMAPTLNLDGTPDTGYFTPVIFSWTIALGKFSHVAWWFYFYSEAV